MRTNTLFGHLDKYRGSREKRDVLEVLADSFRIEYYEHGGDWAAKCRKLTRAESSEPGMFDWTKTPFMKEVYEDAESGLYGRIALVCSAQTSKTETFLNILGRRYDVNPVAGVIALPTKDLCKNYSRKRLAKLIENSTLRKKCFSKDDQIFEKVINGHFLSFAWSTSPNTLCSNPYGFALLDELDRFQEDAHGEGDPVTLIEARGTTFSDFLMLLNSTPTIEGVSAIVREFEKGTKRKLHFICLKCANAFLPILQNLKWDKDAPWTARLVCPHCQHEMYDDVRETLIKNYVYLSDTQTYVDGKVVGELPRTRVASYWVYGLASPWKTFVERATAFYEAYKKNDQFEIQACVNTCFGELYRIKGDAPELSEIESCRLDYVRGTVPSGVQALLAGIDCQKNRFYYVIRGYIQGGESFLVRYGELYGAIEDKKHWDELYKLLTVPYMDSAGKPFPISYAMIDSGYQSHSVYDFCLRDPMRIFPAKGQAIQRAPVMPSSITHNNKSFKLYHIHDSYFKEKIYSEVKKADKTWHLPSDVSEDYLKSVLSEQLVITAAGVKKWVKVRERNDFLDCEKLVDSLAFHLGVFVPIQKTGVINRVVSRGVTV